MASHTARDSLSRSGLTVWFARLTVLGLGRIKTSWMVIGVSSWYGAVGSWLITWAICSRQALSLGLAAMMRPLPM